MSIYNDKTILLVGGLNLVDAPFITRLIEAGAKEVRVLDGTETAVQALRDKLNLEPETSFLRGRLDRQCLYRGGDEWSGLCVVCPCHSPCF